MLSSVGAEQWKAWQIVCIPYRINPLQSTM